MVKEPLQVSLTIPDEVVNAIAAALTERLLPILRSATSAEQWPEWMAIDTAARYLDVSPQRLRKLVARRQIPFHQEDTGCRILFRRSDLDQWMAGFRVDTRTEKPW
jgi:excisionase family DNA binding protein